MRTPGEDERLIRGLLFTEGLITEPQAAMHFDTGNGSAYECAHIIDVPGSTRLSLNAK